MKNVLFISLGCDKNLVDSEKMLGLLQDSGYTVVEEESMADAIVVNTCCFIHDAREESIETIIEMAEWKKKGRLKALVIAGCLAQRYQSEMEEAIPEVDAVIGTTGYTEIVPILDQILAGREQDQMVQAKQEGLQTEQIALQKSRKELQTEQIKVQTGQKDLQTEEKELQPGRTDKIEYTEGDMPVEEASDQSPESTEKGKKGLLTWCPSIDRLPESLSDRRVVTTGGYTAYLKIAEGCNKRCTYCIIPYVRGRYRSFPMEDLIDEARRLARDGTKELILVAQETTVYGVDCYDRKALPELLDKLCEIEGLEWIRILYCYPEEITDELIETIRKQPKICHYLDIPIQHSEDRILKRMGRRTNRSELEQLIARLRERIPDIVLRTTLITGFPGETEEEFEAMVDFVDQMEFDRLGVFTYSPEDGTPAAEMADQIPEEVKADRRDRIMALQQEISAAGTADRIGSVMDVLIEGYLYEEEVYAGRTYMDAPNVDGEVFVHAEEELMSGDIVPVHITGSGEYDLMGDVIYEDEFTE